MPDPLLQQRLIAGDALAAHLRWLLAELDVDLVLDVGANRGQFAQGLREGGYAGRIVSFEPAAAPRAELTAAAAADPAWEVRPWALGDADGEAVLHAVDEQSELGSLHQASDFGRGWKESMGRTRPEPVAVRRLDDVWEDACGSAGRVLLKLDTQGHDLAAFRGAGTWVTRHPSSVVAVLSEVACLPIYDDMPTMTEQLAAYADAGWALAGLYPVSFDRATRRVIEFDALLVVDPAR